MAAALGPYGQAALGRPGAGAYSGAEMAVRWHHTILGHLGFVLTYIWQALQQYKDMMARAGLSPSSLSAMSPGGPASLGGTASQAAAAAALGGHQVECQTINLLLFNVNNTKHVVNLVLSGFSSSFGLSSLLGRCDLVRGPVCGPHGWIPTRSISRGVSSASRRTKRVNGTKLSLP